MTTRAREALADCEHALADFNASANTFYQRPRWVAVMTLLRTVGLVLKAVDRPAAVPNVQKRIDDAWTRLNATKPEPRIFHEFIDAALCGRSPLRVVGARERDDSGAVDHVDARGG